MFDHPRQRRSRIAVAVAGLIPLIAWVAAVADSGSASPRVASSFPALSTCDVFPDPPASTPANAPSIATEAAWNQDISKAPVASNSAAVIAYINGHGGSELHPDFGSPRSYGFPYAVVGRKQRKLRIHFTAYGSESDKGPYPVPRNAPVEGGAGSDGDRHVLVVDKARCRLYELSRAFPKSEGGAHWDADSGTAWDLRSAKRRSDGYTSADAAGLPIFPGLVRLDEVKRGRIDHAIRVTFQSTRDAWIHPASHCAGDTLSSSAPSMGTRLRLKAGYGLGRLSGPAKVIATAFKHFGMIVADNGSNWFFSGTSDPRWPDENLYQLKDIPGSAFEVVRSAAKPHTC